MAPRASYLIASRSGPISEVAALALGMTLNWRPSNACSMAAAAALLSSLRALTRTPPNAPAPDVAAAKAGPPTIFDSSITRLIDSVLAARSSRPRTTPTTRTRAVGPCRRSPSSGTVAISSGAQNVRISSSPTATPDCSMKCSLTTTSSVLFGANQRPSTRICSPSKVLTPSSSTSVAFANHSRSGSVGRAAVSPRNDARAAVSTCGRSLITAVSWTAS